MLWLSQKNFMKEKEEDIEKYIIVKQNEAHDRLVAFRII